MSDDVDSVGATPAGVDGRLVDPGFLVNADPGEVLGLLDTASGPAARLTAAVYQESAHVHRDADAGLRRQLLAMDGARYGDRALSARITAVPVENEPAARWGVEWATGTRLEPRFPDILAGHTDEVDAVATVLVGGRPVVVAATAGWGATVRVFDLTDGRQLCRPLTNEADNWVGAVGAVVDGRPLAVSANWAGVQVWDRATREPIGKTLTDSVTGVATAMLEGRPVAVSSAEYGRESGYENAARVWDLATHEEIGDPITGHACMMVAVATAALDGRPVVLTASWDAVRVWDLATREQIGERLTDRVTTMTTGLLDGRQVAVTGGETEDGSGHGTVRVWDLATREQIGPDLAFPLPVGSLALAPGDKLVVGFGWEVAVLTHR